VPDSDRPPTIRGVAISTLPGRHYVRLWFELRSSALSCRRHKSFLQLAKRYSAGKSHKVIVTGFARLNRWNVSSRFPKRPYAVVTRCTSGRNTVVVHRSAGKCHEIVVTRFARLMGWDMERVFSRRRTTIVASGTSCRDARVIHLGAGKRHSALVTLFAGLTGWNVFYCFARRTHPVVTRGTPA
jgi:hypothetical protein